MASGEPHKLDVLLREQFAEPLLAWLIARCAQDAARKPVLALQACVGAGKTTLSRQLQALAAAEGLRLAVASIDDAYWPWSERQTRMAGNPFGVSRVPPGSHDPELLRRAIAQWRHGAELLLPRFDKTLRDGAGDRCGWSRVEADALLLEGWLLGYEPQTPPAISAWQTSCDCGLSSTELAWLPRWNEALEAYQPLWECCDSFWVLQPADWSWVLRWRLQAEARQRRRGGQALSGAAIKQMVRATLASLPPQLYQPQLDSRAEAVALLDRRRRCLEIRPRRPRP